MKKNNFIVLFLFVLGLFFSACSDRNDTDNKCYSNTSNKDTINAGHWCDKSNSVEWVKTNAQKTVSLEHHYPNEVKDEIQRQCNNLIKEDFGDDAAIDEILTAGFDINDDGIMDYFTVSFPKKTIGNSLPPLYLFISDNGGYKMINIPMETDVSITVMKNKTNGCFDLLWDDFGNTLTFDGDCTYVGKINQPIKTIFFPIKTENDKNIIKICIPYLTESYSCITTEPYCLEACFFDENFNKIFVITSNDEQFNSVVYSQVPANGEYYFYLNSKERQMLPQKINIELKIFPSNTH